MTLDQSGSLRTFEVPDIPDIRLALQKRVEDARGRFEGERILKKLDNFDRSFWPLDD